MIFNNLILYDYKNIINFVNNIKQRKENFGKQNSMKIVLSVKSNWQLSI